MTNQTELFADAHRELRRSLMALRLEVPEAIADDVEAKVNAVVSGLTETLDRALGLAHFNTLDGKTYEECRAIRNEARGGASIE